MRDVTIEMPYPGDVISVNHYLGRRRDGGVYVKAEAKAWMDHFGWLIKSEHIEEWDLPLTVKCDGRFQNQRSQPDLSNLSKCILDAIEETTGINDVNMRWQDGQVTYGEPTLWITVEENDVSK